MGFPPALEVILGPKRDARRQLKDAGLPYTAVVSHMFANWGVGTLGELTKAHTVLTDEVNVYDGGNNKGTEPTILDCKETAQCKHSCIASICTATPAFQASRLKACLQCHVKSRGLCRIVKDVA